jgi:hypothetical protein
MPKPVAPRPVPCLEALTVALNAVLANSAIRSEKPAIVDRVPAIWSSTYPSEIVIWCAGQLELKLYCKYMAGLRYQSYGHRGGLQYEAEVYGRVLESSRCRRLGSTAPTRKRRPGIPGSSWNTWRGVFGYRKHLSHKALSKPHAGWGASTPRMNSESRPRRHRS